jgi:Abnormal spindle-like microcephaly-assoc'd, ASPM-SPD-2-Hydin
MSRKLKRAMLGVGCAALLASPALHAENNRIGGISTRSYVGNEPSQYLIAGIFVSNAAKKVVIRASSVDGIFNPKLSIKTYPDGKIIYANSDWISGESASELRQLDAAKWVPSKPTDAAIIANLVPGLYTAEVAPENVPGIGIIEVYELNTQGIGKLGGISTRSQVNTGENKMIAGVFVQGDPKKLIVRASTVDGVLDPRLTIKNYPKGEVLFNNTSWINGQSAAELQQLEKGKWAPVKQSDAALVTTLNPGLFTFEVDPEGQKGIGLIEVYEYPCASPVATTSQAANAMLNFGSVKVGESAAAQMVNFTNSGCNALTVNASGLSSDFTVTPAALNIAPNTTQGIGIKCVPSSEGMKTSVLKVATNDPAQPQLSFNLVCSGLKKDVVVEPPPVEVTKPIFKAVSPLNPSDSIKLTGQVGQPVSQSILVSNAGLKSANLKVDFANFVGSASDFSITPKTMELPAQATGIFVVECKPSETQREVGLILKTNDLSANAIVNYRLTCDPVISLPQFDSYPVPDSNLNFGEALLDKTMTREILITNFGNGDLNVNSLGIEGDATNSLSVLPPFALTIPKNGTKTMTVQCKPTQSGNFVATLKLVTNDPQNKFVGYNLQCGGKGTPNFTTQPAANSEINFGNVSVGSMVTQQLVVSETGTADLQIMGANITGLNANDFSLTPTQLTIPDGSAPKSFAIQCKPTKEGICTADLTLTTNAPNATASYKLKCQGKQDCAPDYPFSQTNPGAVIPPGYGHDHNWEVFKPQSCLTGSMRNVGTTTALLETKILGSHEELVKDMGFGGKLGLTYKIFKLGAEMDFAAKNTTQSNSKLFVLEYTMKTANSEFLVQHPAPLTIFGQERLNKGEWCFKNACGDQYVSQTIRGARLYLAMKFNFDTETTAKSFNLSTGISIGNILNVLKVEVSKMSQQSRSNSSVTVTAYQQGGYAQNLASILSPATISQCSLEKFDQCVSVISSAIGYAQTLNTNAPKDPATLDYVFSPYSSVGVDLPVEAIPLDVTEIRTQLANEFLMQRDDFLKAKEWLEGNKSGLFSTEARQSLMKISTATSINQDLLREAAKQCFMNMSQCALLKQQVFEKLGSYDRNWLRGIRLVQQVTQEPITRSSGFSLSASLGTVKIGGWLPTFVPEVGKKCPDDGATACLPEGCQANSAALSNGGYHSPGSGGDVNRPTYRVDNRCFRGTAKVCTHEVGPSRADYSGTVTVYGTCSVTKEVLEIPTLSATAIIGIL